MTGDANSWAQYAIGIGLQDLKWRPSPAQGGVIPDASVTFL
jgi:hypothetical protein